MSKEITVLLSLVKSTLKEKKEGIISAQEADKTFLEIKAKMDLIDADISKSFFDKLVDTIEF